MKRWIFTLLISLSAGFYLNAQILTDFESAGYTITYVNYATAPVVAADPADAANDVLTVVKNIDTTFNQSVTITFDTAVLIEATANDFAVAIKSSVTGARGYLWAYAYDGEKIADAWLNTVDVADAWTRLTYTGVFHDKYIKSIQLALGGWDNGNVPPGFQGTYYLDTIQIIVPETVTYVDPRKTVEIENIDDAVIDYDGLALEDFWVDQDLFAVNGGGDSATFSAEFSAGWDDDYLYLFVQVADDSAFDFVDDPADNWEKDGIQIYVDVRNKLIVGGKNDFLQHQITMPFSVGDYPFTTYIYAGAGADATAFYVQDTMDTYMAGKCVKGTSDYTMELRLPWAAMYFNNDDVKTKEQCAAAVSVAKNTVVGFELQVNDYNGDAATGSRKNIVTWSAISTDNPGSYQNSGVWGGLKLVNTSAIDQSLSNAARIYPNPNNGQFTVELEGMNSINIYDVTGRQVYTQLVTSDNAVINAENLVKGIYFVQVNTNGNSAIQKIEIR